VKTPFKEIAGKNEMGMKKLLGGGGASDMYRVFRKGLFYV